MAQHTLRVVLLLLPLVAGLIFLRLLPAAALAVDQPTMEWRFDPLVLIGCSILLFGSARLEPLLKGLRTALAVAGLLVALLVTAPAMQVLSVILVSLLVLHELGPRWFIASALFTFVTLGPMVTTVSTALTLHATILMAFIGSGGLPWPGSSDVGSEIVLRPFWLFVMLRTLVFEPWPVPTVVIATSLGTIALAIIAYEVLQAPANVGRERTLAALLMMAFVTVGQNTILGVVAALWALAMHAALTAAGPRKTYAPLTVVCITFGVAAWWTVGAVAAAGAFLGALIVCFTSVAVCIATLLGARRIKLPGSSVVERFLVLFLIVALMLGSPWVTTTLALPVAGYLGAGLTAPGLLETWSFIGVSALDAGHRRVTLAPSVVLGCLYVIIWAVVWLVSRVGVHVPPSSVELPDDAAQRAVRGRVWWLR